MDFTYNKLSSHDNELHDMRRDLKDMYDNCRDLNREVGGLVAFRDTYRGDILQARVDSEVAHQRINVIEADLHRTIDRLDAFINNFNKWADIIKENQTAIATLKNSVASAPKVSETTVSKNLGTPIPKTEATKQVTFKK